MCTIGMIPPLRVFCGQASAACGRAVSYGEFGLGVQYGYSISAMAMGLFLTLHLFAVCKILQSTFHFPAQAGYVTLMDKCKAAVLSESAQPVGNIHRAAGLIESFQRLSGINVIGIAHNEIPQGTYTHIAGTIKLGPIGLHQFGGVAAFQKGNVRRQFGQSGYGIIYRLVNGGRHVISLLVPVDAGVTELATGCRSEIITAFKAFVVYLQRLGICTKQRAALLQIVTDGAVGVVPFLPMKTAQRLEIIHRLPQNIVIRVRVCSYVDPVYHHVKFLKPQLCNDGIEGRDDFMGAPACALVFVGVNDDAEAILAETGIILYVTQRGYGIQVCAYAVGAYLYSVYQSCKFGIVYDFLQAYMAFTPFKMYLVYSRTVCPARGKSVWISYKKWSFLTLFCIMVVRIKP